MSPTDSLAQGERRLAVIMFTDIAGYTALAQTDERQAMELLEDQRSVVRETLARHRGREVKTMGDGFLVEFSSALEAVQCALDIQTWLRSRNGGRPLTRQLNLRIGVHLGDVIGSGGDILGDAVNVASRIEPLSEPGGVAVSEQVYDQVRNKGGLRFEKLQGPTLKNVSVPMDVYRLVMAWEGFQPVGENDTKRVAVLPLISMSPDPNDGYFSDGMTEELISALSKVPGLKVISRTSAMQYKGQSKHVSEIGRELGVGTVIEGSVRKAGNRVRIALQLIDANTDNHVWAENYDRDLDDVFAIQSDIASKVSKTLQAGVFSAEKPETFNPEAYTLYLRGTQLYYEGTEHGLREAIRLLERSEAEDPGFAKAPLALSKVWVRLANYGFEPFPVIQEKAVPAAERAIRLQPGLGEAHAALSMARQFLDDFDGALAEAEEAVRLNANSADAYSSLGFQYGTIADLDRAEESLRKAMELDPISIHVARTLAMVLEVNGKVDEELELLTKMKELYPKNARVYEGLASAYVAKGDLRKAQEMLDIGGSTGSDEPLLSLMQAMVYLRTGKPDKAEEVYQMLQRNKSPSVKTFSTQFIEATKGNLDQLFEALDVGVETHVWPFLIKSLPVFEEARRDPRFAQWWAKVAPS